MRAVLLCSKNDLGHHVLRSLDSVGAKVFLIHDKRTAASVGLSRRRQGILLASPRLTDEAPEKLLRLINDFHAREPVDVVIGSDVVAMKLLHGIRADLAPAVFPFPDLETLRVLDNKWHFYNLCLEIGIDAPQTRFFATKNDIDPHEISRDFRYPVVVKPVSRHGAIGFEMIADRGGLETRILRNPAYDHPDLLIQEYVPGIDLGLSVFARDGRVEYWTTFNCGKNWGTEFCERPELLALGKRLIAATRFSGVANFDARLDAVSGAIRMLECNPRFFARTTATRLCGLDFVRAGLAAIGLVQLDEPCLCRGEFYPASQLLSIDGWKRLLAGRWPVRPMLRNLGEIISDPLPIAARNLGLDAAA